MEEGYENKGSIQASGHLYDLREVVESLQLDSRALATKALGLIELALMATAPMLFTHDHWIQYIIGQPVEWIPAHNTRLLHPNTLLQLLRSDLGAHCMQQWREVQWQGYLLDDLESLRKLDGFYPDDSSVLKLHVAADGTVTTVVGGLATRC
ncbi:unnamed protein product [Peronospora destructor]|uniref:Uncharacterized protein n=1 Tax=Peronospora destructor TaxID=86335 RepID=A0AAV0THG6_9STRA|nr:unnamed protein product [Peronospora destructor]